MLNLFLQCYTIEEISAAVGMPEKTVHDLSARIRNYEIPPIPGQFTEDQPDDSASEKVKREWDEQRQQKIVAANSANADHSSDFDVPIYNVWKQQTKSEGSEHFGNSEVRWMDNLLHLYTKPFDVVFDPFGGGGSSAKWTRQEKRAK